MLGNFQLPLLTISNPTQSPKTLCAFYTKSDSIFLHRLTPLPCATTQETRSFSVSVPPIFPVPHPFSSPPQTFRPIFARRPLLSLLSFSSINTLPCVSYLSLHRDSSSKKKKPSTKVEGFLVNRCYLGSFSPERNLIDRSTESLALPQGSFS